jgi:hypothetical protein
VDPVVGTLIGVVVGGLSSTGGAVFLDSRKARRERKANEAAELSATRLAVRLVLEELAEASALIEDAAKPDSRRYWPQPRRLPTAVWNEYRVQIASVIESPLSWRNITSAYDAINNLNWTVNHRRTHSQEVGVAVHGALVRPHDGTRSAWRSIRAAIGELEATIGVQGPASRMMREQEEAEAEFWRFGDGDDFDADAADVWQHEGGS